MQSCGASSEKEAFAKAVVANTELMNIAKGFLSSSLARPAGYGRAGATGRNG